jgi:hypothetical protein
LDKYFISSNNIVAKTTAVQKTSTTQTSGVKFTKIQDVEVGERAIGTNPEITDSERSVFLPDPEPATWRKLTLEMIKSNGKRLDITLLRSLVWIEESNAAIGATIYLDLPEMGAQGSAKVLKVEPCPPIKHGKGNVITGTFHHEAANTIDLHVEGLDKPIGCTNNHPFWSVTRNEFIEAGKLQQGEELQLHNGQTAKVIQILPRPGPERVHNLEVMNEHVYRISYDGVLVHNACAISRFDNGGGHHIFAKKAFEGAAGYDVNAAFCIPQSEFSSGRFNHQKMTGKQHELYAELERSGRSNTLEEHARIARESLIAGGVDPGDAAALVHVGMAQMKGWEIQPVRIPWY